jgi:hypothetical protein
VSAVTAGLGRAAHPEPVSFGERAMTDRVHLTWQGREYQAARRSGESQGAGNAQVWEVTSDGAQVTSFPAEPGDRPGEVEEKIVRWLEGNAARPTQDIGRQ